MLTRTAVLRTRKNALIGLGALLLGGCGSSPTGPTDPSPPPPGSGNVNVDAVVFYDENGDRQLGANEVIRLPEVTLVVAGRSAATDFSGVASLSVSPGRHAIEVDAGTLPPFFAIASLNMEISSGARLEVPATLSIGSNQPNLMMAFGDSITTGFRSSDGTGYRGPLEGRLRSHFGPSVRIANEGIDGQKSDKGAARIDESLGRVRPAMTLIHYGVNDWNNRNCQFDRSGCPTVANLRFMLEAVRRHESLPFLATILPANTFFDERTPPQRNDWVRDTNRELRALAAELGAVVVDLEAAFTRDGPPDKSGLYADHVHPNDEGYRVMAETFFAAMSHGRPGVAALSLPLWSYLRSGRY